MRSKIVLSCIVGAIGASLLLGGCSIGGNSNSSAKLDELSERVAILESKVEELRGQNPSSVIEIEETTEEKTTEEVTEKETDTKKEETTGTTEETTKETETATKKEEETTEKAVDISEDWLDLEFVLDGTKYQIPFAFSKLEKQGWNFDLEAYGYEEGYILNKGDKTYGTISIENKKYPSKSAGSDVDLQIGFENTSSKQKDILDCDIWSFDLDILWAKNYDIAYPEMVIAKGITWGDSMEKVKEVLGEPSDEYTAEDANGFSSYTYEAPKDSKNSTAQMRLEFTDNQLSGITIKRY